MKINFDKTEYIINNFKIKKSKFSLEFRLLTKNISINFINKEVKKGGVFDDFP